MRHMSFISVGTRLLMATTLCATGILASPVAFAQTTCTLVASSVAHPDTSSYPTADSCLLYNAPSGSSGIAVWGEADGFGQTAIQGFSNYGIGIGGQGDEGVVGIGTGTAGVSGLLQGTGGATSAGVFGAEGSGPPVDTSGSVGVYGTSKGGDGGHFLSSAGYGVYGTTSSSSSAGGYFVASSSDGVVGLSGTSTAPNSYLAGVVGSGSGSDVQGGYFVSGNANGIIAQSANSVGDSGVAGTCTGSGSNCNGVYGRSSGAAGSGAGVYGTNTGSGYGGYFSSTNGIGLYAKGYSYGIEATGTATGVYGSTTNALAAVTAEDAGSGYGVYAISASSYSGWFVGVVDITGGLKVGSTCEFGSCSVSDRRLKKNIEPLNDALGSLLKLRGRTFEWREPDTSPQGHGDETGVQTGFIAQEVETVFPSWISTNKQGFKTLNIPSKQMAALTVESLRALQVQNDELRAEIARLQPLQAKVALLEADHAKLIRLADHVDSLENGKDPMTGDRGMLWLVAMVVAVGGSIIVTRRQSQA